MANVITTKASLAHFRTAAAVDVSSLKVTFGPKQSGTGDPSPSNVRVINGVNSITVSRIGKNLFDYATANILNYKRCDDNGDLVDDTNGSFNQSFIPVNPNTTYIVSGSTATSGIRIYHFSINKSWISRSNLISDSPFTFTTPSNCYYVQIQLKRESNSNWPGMQVEFGTNASSYEAYAKQDIILALDDTFYGGYVNLISGTLTVTMGIVDLGTLGWAKTNYSNMFRALVPDGLVPSSSQQGTGIGWCETYTVVKKQYSDMNDYEMGCNNWSMGSDYYGICIKDPNYSDSQVFKASLNGVHFVYELNTPVTYQLAPQTLKTLRGVNNIWSNDGDIEVTYPLNETKDIIAIKKRIIASQPHLATAASGNTDDSATIAHFNTDVLTNVKELKVTFSAQQSGIGDPSPNNMRPITGVSNVSVTRAGVNLLSVINSTSTKRHGITYTEQRNSDGQVTSITAKGTTTQANAFMNLNYEANKFNWIYGKIATCAYSPQVNIPAVLNGGQQWTIDEEWVDSFSSAGWQRYELAHRTEATGEWFRTQIYPYTANTAVDTTIYPFVCLDSNRGCEFEPYRGQTITMALGDTFYGGYVDLMSGMLTITHKLYTFTGQESTGFINWKGYLVQVSDSKSANNSYVVTMCSHTNNCITGGGFWSTASEGNDIAIAGSQGGQLRFRNRNICTDPNNPTLTEYQNYLQEQYAAGTPVQAVYLLETPTTYQLTPQTLKTLRGINNIWSDQGTVEVKYWTH